MRSILIACLLALVFTGCLESSRTQTSGQDPTSAAVSIPPPLPSLAQAAIGEGNLNTLAVLINAAGLSGALTGDSPLTIFAPSDDAFSRLPPGTVNALLNDPNLLKQVLLYHVVAGGVRASVAVTLKSADTLQGTKIRLNVSGGRLYINGGQVTQADILARNGVIHVIDKVLIPPKNIIETAQAAGTFATLLAAVDVAGLREVLSSLGPVTLFAPNDAAFAKIPAATLNALLADPAALRKVLLYHLAQGEVPSYVAITLSQITSVQGQSLLVNVVPGDLYINTSRVITADVYASNGVIHVIDTVLLPQ